MNQHNHYDYHHQVNSFSSDDSRNTETSRITLSYRRSDAICSPPHQQQQLRLNPKSLSSRISHPMKDINSSTSNATIVTLGCKSNINENSDIPLTSSRPRRPFLIRNSFTASDAAAAMNKPASAAVICRGNNS